MNCSVPCSNSCHNMQCHCRQITKPIPRCFDTFEPQWANLAMLHLGILMHSHKCQKSPDGDKCTKTHCKTMKDVLKHIAICPLGAECNVKLCASSKKIICHWRYCKRVECTICQPLRKE